MQIEEIFDESDLSSDDGSYLVDSRDFQFSEKTVSKSEYAATTDTIGKTGLKIKLNRIRDTKNLLLDSGSTFSVCNNPKMLINLRKFKRPISGVSSGGVLVTVLKGDLPFFHGLSQSGFINEYTCIK